MIRFEQLLNVTRQVAPKILGALMLAAVIVPNPAEAVLMQADVSFTWDGGTPAPTPPSDPASVSFSFQFDSSNITGSSYETIGNIPLTSISLSLGGVDFLPSDAIAEIDFLDGTANNIFIYGLLDGSSIFSQSSGPDFIFSVFFEFSPLIFESFTYALPGQFFGAFDARIVISDLRIEEVPVVVAVPEPATLALFSLGLIGLGAIKRRGAGRKPTHQA